MKKTLLFTAALLVATFTSFAQATALDPTANETKINISATNYTQAFTSGTWQGGIGSQVSVTDPSLINGTISFDVVSSGADFVASINFHVRKLNGNSGSIDFTVDGTTDTTTLTSVPTDVDDFDKTTNINVSFSQNVTITSVPKTITLDVNNIIKDAATNAAFRFYSVTFTKVNSLATNDYELNNAVINMYPNPVVTSFSINSSISIENVKLYNVIGRLLKTFDKEANYDISDLATGMYFANIQTEFGSKTIRIIKK